ncbi:hypothetical protein Moror_9598 [Moniliophthora roreri MCA 2997]|uniref:Uncharacterized protein n=1 Tax=Moniliophthora roreri (strain MCA 2997) TaxID=1381753 RepID=V2XBH0_MONRO|nr:hypothetical protein Moror_9598 [Moniliophthora roreri MCA 2997]
MSSETCPDSAKNFVGDGFPYMLPPFFHIDQSCKPHAIEVCVAKDQLRLARARIAIGCEIGERARKDHQHW